MILNEKDMYGFLHTRPFFYPSTKIRLTQPLNDTIQKHNAV